MIEVGLSLIIGFALGMWYERYSRRRKRKILDQNLERFEEMINNLDKVAGAFAKLESMRRNKIPRLFHMGDNSCLKD